MDYKGQNKRENNIQNELKFGEYMLVDVNNDKMKLKLMY